MKLNHRLAQMNTERNYFLDVLNCALRSPYSSVVISKDVNKNRDSGADCAAEIEVVEG